MNLKELQALRDAATAGSWEADEGRCLVIAPKSAGKPFVASFVRPTDAKFICALHDAVRMLEALGLRINYYRVSSSAQVQAVLDDLEGVLKGEKVV